ncbi:MAG: DUF4288 domain-containing protein [Flavobacteriales bacterium]
MNWYIVKLVFHIKTKHGCDNTQFEESHRLIQAPNAMQAFHHARSLGASEDAIFLNKAGSRVHWQFVDVTDVRALDSIVSGTEVFSQVCEFDNSTMHLSLVKQQAHFAIQQHTIYS